MVNRLLAASYTHLINPRLAKKRTVMSKIARKQGKKRALAEEGIETDIERFPFREEDLRYYRVKKKPKRESNACLLYTSFHALQGNQQHLLHL